MENIVNLEQLDYRDQLIKGYIDEHSSGGGGSSDYTALTGCVWRQMIDDYDTQLVYLGIPEGYNPNDYEIRYLRFSKTRNRDPQKTREDWNKDMYKGWHQIWAIPQKEKRPLFEVIFKNPESKDFTKNGFDFYEIEIVYDGDHYSLVEFINEYVSFDYKYKDANDNLVNLNSYTLLSHRQSGLRLYKDGKPASNIVKFYALYSEDLGENRIKIWE